MNLSMTDNLTGMLGTVAISGQSETQSLPAWLEAGLFGLVVGAYIGLFLALRFRRPMARAVARLRTRRFLRSDLGVKGAPSREHVLRDLDRVEYHLDGLASASESRQPDAWRTAVEDYRDDLNGLRDRLE